MISEDVIYQVMFCISMGGGGKVDLVHGVFCRWLLSIAGKIEILLEAINV